MCESEFSDGSKVLTQSQDNGVRELVALKIKAARDANANSELKCVA
jgi:hypothetical protein